MGIEWEAGTQGNIWQTFERGFNKHNVMQLALGGYFLTFDNTIRLLTQREQFMGK